MSATEPAELRLGAWLRDYGPSAPLSLMGRDDLAGVLEENRRLRAEVGRLQAYLRRANLDLEAAIDQLADKPVPDDVKAILRRAVDAGAIAATEREACAALLDAEAQRLMDEGDEYDPLIAHALRRQATTIRERGKA